MKYLLSCIYNVFLNWIGTDELNNICWVAWLLVNEFYIELGEDWFTRRILNLIFLKMKVVSVEMSLRIGSMRRSRSFCHFHFFAGNPCLGHDQHLPANLKIDMEMHPGRFQTTNTTPAAHQHNNTGSENNTTNQLQAANLWINNMRQHLKVSNNNLRILIEDRDTFELFRWLAQWWPAW